MQMNSRTTVTELLANGAFIEGRNGESLSELLSVGDNKEWLHDLPISKLIEKNAIICLPNGMNISRKGSEIVVTRSKQEARLSSDVDLACTDITKMSDYLGVSLSSDFQSNRGFSHLSQFA